MAVDKDLTWEVLSVSVNLYKCCASTSAFKIS